MQSKNNWMPKGISLGLSYLKTEKSFGANEIEINENSILRLHEINLDNKIMFEPPVCMHADCLEE